MKSPAHCLGEARVKEPMTSMRRLIWPVGCPVGRVGGMQAAMPVSSFRDGPAGPVPCSTIRDSRCVAPVSVRGYERTCSGKGSEMKAIRQASSARTKAPAAVEEQATLLAPYHRTRAV